MAEQWQRAVEAVLSEHLPAAQARDAADLWRRRYASGRASTVIAFVRDLSTRFELDSRDRHTLRTAIYRALMYGAQSPEPAAVDDDYPAPQAREVAAALVDHIRHAASLLPGGGTALPEELAVAVADEPTLAARGDAVTGWLAGEAGMPALDERALAAAVHALYVAACRAFGPVTGDKLLHVASTRAAALPAAARYPVARLLYPE